MTAPPAYRGCGFDMAADPDLAMALTHLRRVQREECSTSGERAAAYLATVRLCEIAKAAAVTIKSTGT